MKRKMMMILAVLLVLILPVSLIYAEEEVESAGISESDIAEDEFSVLDMEALYLDESAEVSTTPFSLDYTKTALFTDITQGFIIGDWDVLDTKLTLSFSTTQLASAALSNITLSINGIRFYSESIPVTDGKRRELTAKIPVEHLVPGYNALTIEAYIRTTDGLPCVDDVTSANWLNVFKESFIEVSYHPDYNCRTIDEFYSCFTSLDALENSRSAVVLPTNYDTDELDAALTILAGVSGSADKYEKNIALISADDSKLNDYQYMIYTGKAASLPESSTGNVSGDPTSGYIGLKRGDPTILTVTGGSAASLDKAANAMANPDWIHQLKTAEKTIDDKEDIYTRRPSESQFIGLTDDGMYLDGPFRQSTDFFIDFNNNQTVAYGSTLTLNYRYAENLDFSRSLVTVYLNGVPIGSQKLSADQAEGDTLTLDIPTDIDIVGDFTLTVAFDLELPDIWCTLRQGETPWAWITPSSELKISGVEIPYYLFENFPYPMVSQGAFNNLVLILPDDIHTIDPALLGGLALTLGQFIEDNSGSFNVASASSPGELDGKNVIAVGTYNTSPIIAGLNEHLFFKFYDNGAGIMSNEKMLIEPQYSTTLATAQLIDSPYSKTRNAILVLGAASIHDLPHALSQFSDADTLWQLYGDGLVTDGDDLFLYRFKSENAKETSTVETLLSRTDLLTLALAGGAVFILLIIALILMLVKYKRSR